MNFIRGDWRFFWPENIADIAHIPSAWDSILNTGLGISSIPSLWITSYLNFTASFSKIGLSWNAISIIFWFAPIVIISCISSYLLFRYLFSKSKHVGFIAGFLYVCNTYFLLIFGGGQMGVAFAYSVLPFVLLAYLKLFSNLQLKKSIIFALTISLQLLFDPRIVYVTVTALAVYWLIHFSWQDLKKRFVYICIIPGLLTCFLHSYWILPFITTRGSSVPKEFLNSSNLSFFSFADFSHAVALLHPNWPENIFGKVYFLQPEFLLLPVLAFSSLFFIKRKNTSAHNILYFNLIGLIGIFLAKGVNPPFGQVYSFLFTHLPGFNLFRDPTKWYMLIALSYAMVIPFTLTQIYFMVREKKRLKDNYMVSVLFCLIIFYVLFLIRPVFFSNSLFRPKFVPKEYFLLKEFLVKQKKFSRTLWIPYLQRYGFFSELHPAIGRGELFHEFSASGQITQLQKSETKTLIKLAGIQYIIVPFDSEGEIFVKDHTYNAREFNQTVYALTKIPWVKKINGFGNIAVFENREYADHIFINSSINQTVPVRYKQISETAYTVDSDTLKKGDTIIFSETYDTHWTMRIGSREIPSKPFNNRFNSFYIQDNGLKNITIVYRPQKWVNLGSLISFFTLVGIALLIKMTASGKK